MITTIKCHNCGKEVYYNEMDKLNWIKTRNNDVYCPNCIISLYEKLLDRLKIKERTRLCIK